MNAKAERIEHLIQIINRNLLLIYNGQIDGVIPLEQRSSGKIDSTVFNSDKFGYEMINFVRSFVKTQKLTLSAIWERNFVKGLETLITECAVVKDDIERECFVSRVYVWFTDKLVERRDLPDLKQKKNTDFRSLRASLQKSGGNHSVKALDNYEASMPKDGDDGYPVIIQKEAPEDDNNDIHLPSIQSVGGGARPAHHSAVVQQSYPAVLDPDMGAGGYQPETEAELVMHDLWLARRRQEAFEWKAKQNLHLIMDRRSLHKSRLESDTLRRQETSSYLARGVQKTDEYQEPEEPYDEDTRFAPKMRRPLSGRKHFANIMDEAENDKAVQCTKHSAIPEPTHLNVVGQNGTKNDAQVLSVTRTVVEKKKKDVLPMRFKIDAPEGYAPSSSRRNSKNVEAQGFTVGGATREEQTSRTQKGSRSHTAPASATRNRKITERKVSVSKLFNEVARMDSELQVHSHFAQFRRMPATEQQQAWLENRVDERNKRNKEYIDGLVSKAESTAPKKSAKGAPKGKKKTDKKVPPPEIKKTQVGSKYASAADFMEKHFPSFDGEESPDAQGVLRCVQLEECNKVFMALAKDNPDIDFATIEKALVTPQDRLEDVCLENMKDPVEGLMVNPLPKEMWRQMTMAKAKKKGKKGKKKK